MERTVDLCDQLAQTDLSEDDTSILLKEASDLNKKLKSELKRIEERKQRASNPQKRTSHKSSGRSSSKPSNVSTRSSLETRKKTFLPPISSISTNTSKKSGSHKALGEKSPYAPVKSNGKSRGAIGLSVDRQTNSAGNPSVSSSKSKRHLTKATERKASHSAESLRTTHTSLP